MKKILIIGAAALALAGCAREYYHGDARYVQSGEDCRYTFYQHGGNFKAGDTRVKIRENKKITYRDASCREIMERDMGKPEIIRGANPAPALVEWRADTKPVVLEKHHKPVHKTYTTRRYYVVPAK